MRSFTLPDIYKYLLKAVIDTPLPTEWLYNKGCNVCYRYSLKAVIDKPWKFDHETRKLFTVVGMMDLNKIEDAPVSHGDALPSSALFALDVCVCVKVNVNVTVKV